MGIHQAVNIAIFGLSLRTLNELKQQVQTAVPDHIQINWSNIAEPQLDILMINQVFFDSPNIKSLLQNNKINVLKIANDENKNSAIENDTLFLPLNHLHPLHHWLSFHLNERLNQGLENIEIESAPSFHRKQIKEVLQEIQNPKNGKIQLFDNQGLVAIADPRNQWLWQHPEFHSFQTDPSLNYTYATQNDLHWTLDTPQQDLQQWLWHLLWTSMDFEGLCPASASSFYLQFSPQPKHKADRQDILRMSACFAQGAQISTVAQQLKLPEQKVRHFVAACLGANCGTLIKDQQAKYQPKASQSEPEQHFMKKLFGRLRHRLGF
ncbi:MULTISPECIES: hypothetical protein [Acinetobacter]|uniref:hypothetical protein n=1 Tax=Acinetobacter TaxID=469 RepID=UPI0005C485AB|nr:MULTISPECIES: hypothetical protein [Acinetobacter]